MNFRKANNITGWVICLIACTVYLLTREATVSFWDCGEFIPCAYKLQISHPPGAPLFILLGRLFIILLGSDPHNAAVHVNTLSSMSSGFTILFLFWTITRLAKKLVLQGKNEASLTVQQGVAILFAGAVGALAFTFSDSFWFSAVEGIVFGVSPLFISVAFWAILKWEEVADQPYGDRWIILIAYLIGLSIGVHLLSLLSIPAVIMTIYFRRYPYTRRKTLLAFVLACAITGIIQILVIQDTVKLIGWFDLFFVNSLGLPFNSGSYTCIALIAALVIIGLRWARRHGKYYLHLGILAFAFILVGYSTYFVILIRANAYPAINMQNVTNPMKLVSYLDRSQYGSWPLLYGPDFTAQPIGTKDTGPVYEKDTITGKYKVVGNKLKLLYNSGDEHILPRLWDNDNSQKHVDFYRDQLGLANGEKPSFGDGIYYFLHDQLWWMYFRYFLWNYAGRQNDIQGVYPQNVRDGNWISGIPFLDNLRLGDQSKMPESLKNNKAHNRLFLLPLLLGIVGLLYQYNRRRKDALVVFLLFFFTGIAIVIYLNQAFPQPRERDYSYVGSFYAFAIWIGLGTLGVYNFLYKKLKQHPACVWLGGIICLVAVPLLMAFQEWDDHDRSQKTLARDIAADYLNSCAPNAIVFTGGDNDTYPLWYAQEVEGVRPDVRVAITTLLGTDWFINDLRRKVNQSDPVPFLWSPDKYEGDNRNYIYYNSPANIPKDKYFNLTDVLNFTGSDDQKNKLQLQSGEWVNYMPTQNFFLPVDKSLVLQNGTVPAQDSSLVEPQVAFVAQKDAFMKNDLAELNIIAASQWKRPIYFTSPFISLGLNDYLQTDGLTYRLVPVRKEDTSGMLQTGNTNLSQMYDNLMTKFAFGGAEKPGTYFDEPNRRELLTLRSAYMQLSIGLSNAGRKDSALKVLRYADDHILESNFPYGLTSPQNLNDYTAAQVVYAYYLAGDSTRAGEIADKIITDCNQQIAFYTSLGSRLSADLAQDQKNATYIIGQLQQMKQHFSMLQHQEMLPQYKADSPAK